MLNTFVWFGNSKIGINLALVLDFVLKDDPIRLEFRTSDKSGRIIYDEKDIHNFLKIIINLSEPEIPDILSVEQTSGAWRLEREKE
jgi:hypothetical protein